MDTRRFVFLVVAVLAALPCCSGCEKTVTAHDVNVYALTKENFSNSIGMQMVRLSSGYWVSAHEVTEQQYAVFTEPPRMDHNNPRFPVRSVSFAEAVAFCEKLTKKEMAEGVLPSGHVYSLPTERQWRTAAADARLEDAVMPTREQKFAPGQLESLRKAGYDVRTQEHFDAPCEVGSRGPNRLGLYDTRGNVFEWCIDWYNPRKRQSRVIR